MWRLLYLFTIAVGTIFLASFIPGWWIFDLLASFVFQYFLVFCLAALLFAYGKRHRELKLALIGVSVTFFMLAPYLLPEKDTMVLADVKGEELRVMFFNIWILNENYQDVADYINEVDPDVVLLTEMADPAYPELKKRLENYPYREFHKDRFEYFDMGIFSKLPLESVEVLTHGIGETPTLVANTTVGGEEVTLLGVHTSAPISANHISYRDSQLGELAEYVASLDGHVVTVGDFNATPWTRSYQRFVEDSLLVDTKQGHGIGLSWPSFMPAFLRIPIDHGLVSRSIEVIDKRGGESFGSDHYPVILDLELH